MNSLDLLRFACWPMGALFLGLLVRAAWLESRAWKRTDNAIKRIGRQARLGAHERITGERIAERRR